MLLIALGQIGGGLLVREMVIKPRLDQIAEGVARNVAAIRAGMLALPPAQRPAFVDGFNPPGGGVAAERQWRRGPRVLLTPLERGFVRSVSARIASQGVGGRVAPRARRRPGAAAHARWKPITGS